MICQVLLTPRMRLALHPRRASAPARHSENLLIRPEQPPLPWHFGGLHRMGRRIDGPPWYRNLLHRPTKPTMNRGAGPSDLSCFFDTAHATCTLLENRGGLPPPSETSANRTKHLTSGAWSTIALSMHLPCASHVCKCAGSAHLQCVRMLSPPLANSYVAPMPATSFFCSDVIHFALHLNVY